MAAADSREVENGCGESGWWSGGQSGMRV